MTPKAREVLDLSVRIAEGLAAVAAAIGVTLAALQYVDSQKAGQAARTIELIDIWEKPVFGALQSYRRLAANFQAAFETRDQTLFATLTPEEGMDRLRQAALARPLARHDFEEVVYFFTRLSLCVEAGVCDTATTQAFFEDTLTGFLQNYGPAITERQAVDRHFGEALFDLQKRVTAAE